MSGVSIGHSHPRPCSGKKTLRRCRNNVEADNVILIDVDSDNFENVIIIDLPESLPKKNQGSSVLRKDTEWPFRNVINIDDDETADSSHFSGVNNVNFSAGTSSNRESFHVAKNFEDSADAAVEDCQFVQDNATPVRISKCKRTYSGIASTRNHYGLDTDSECDLSDNEYPDCELVEDSSGKVQELWEKAFSKRRKDINNGHSGIRDHDSTSDFINRDYHRNAESRDATREHKEASFCSTKGKSNNENGASSPFRTKEDTDFGFIHLSDDIIHDQQYNKSDMHHPSNSQAERCPPIRVEQADCPVREQGSSRRKDPALSNFASQEASNKKFNHPIPIVEDEETSKVESFQSKFGQYVDEDSCNGKSSPIEGEVNICKSKSSFGTKMNQGRSFSRDDDKNVHEMATRNLEESDHFKYRQSHATVVAKEDDSVSNIQLQEDKDSQLPGQNGDILPPVGTCITNEREKLKETDEYKRAIEEEWASRQQALLVQSEEARRLRQLRKRKKAESMRLLDMERRQKERLEEMRNIQKKDEENMNLKDIIRAEVRKELHKLEISCHNMASLLHSLGIQVGSWPNPSPQEVQTAYRRALLTFHPDRAAQSDIRQQVEAEEKFKLINRLKEKFPPS